MARKVAADEAPEITPEVFARMKPMTKVTPGMADAIKAARRGRPRLEDAKQVVSIRLPKSIATRWIALDSSQRLKLVQGLGKKIAATPTSKLRARA